MNWLILQIYNGFDKTDNKLMDTLCGNEIPKTIYNATDNKMLVVMQTDNSIESKGFSAKFKTVKYLTQINSSSLNYYW